MRLDAVTAAQQAAQRRSAALDSLVRDESASVAAVAAVWQETAVWCDGQPGQRPIAVALAEKAANRIEGEVAVAIYANSARLFALAQSKAKAVVDEVAGLPPLPDPIFQSPDPAGDLARHKEHRGTWGVLVGAAQDFEACHAIADQVRDHLGYSADNLEEGAPRHALVFRNWRPQLSDQRYGLLKMELRLPYAAREGWLPGLWTPSDIRTLPVDQTFGGRLINRGAAAGVM
ncbi:MAG: hypothetical protein WAN44_00190 [Propionibacteriaceae bacterium]